MSWYAKTPAPAPEWDVCWDFSNKNRRGGYQQGGESDYSQGRAGGWKGRGRGGGGRGRGGGSWNGQWWGQQQQQPPYWGPMQSFWGGAGMQVPPPWFFQPQAGAVPPPPPPQQDAQASKGATTDKLWWTATGGAKPGKSILDDLGELPPSLEKRISERGGKLPPPAPPPDKEFEGSLKSLSSKHGYGFIACDEVHRMYGRDTYLPQELVTQEMKVLDRVNFVLTLSKKGHPQASSCKILKF